MTIINDVDAAVAFVRVGGGVFAGPHVITFRNQEYPMTTTTVRYIVNDVDTAIAFYRDQLGFRELMRPAPTFAMVAMGDLRLALSAPGGPGGGGQAMPDGTIPEPGGWNRFSIDVDDLDQAVARLEGAGARFRSGIINGVAGRQILVDDPSGNPVELFQAFDTGSRPDASPDAGGAGIDGRRESYEVRPIGWVESSLLNAADAPRQGELGAPDAWLVIHSDVLEGIRDIPVGAEILVFTWLHQGRRDELATRPGDNPSGPELGVFSTRSPARPNPIGLHRVSVVEVQDGRLRVEPLEAIDGTPLVDIKPVLGPSER